MKIDRKALLKTLIISAVGITKREIIEQSNSFVFDDDRLVTFNDAIFTRIENPLPEVEGSVPAEDLLKLLSKFPDDEIEIFPSENELRVKGKNRDAGIAMSMGVQLPFSDVPGPKKWCDLPPELLGTLFQAARVCGRDEALFTTTVVHITSECVEACDNFRLFQSVLDTKMDQELLIPGTSIEMLGDLAFQRFSINGGWLHLETKTNHQVSVRCIKGKYPDLLPLLKFESPKKIQLPNSLPDILDRAEIMQDFNAIGHIAIGNGKLTLQTRKDGGWYRETKSVEYGDDPIKFEVNLKFLHEILQKTRSVAISKNRMRIKSGDTVFIICLEVPDGD